MAKINLQHPLVQMAAPMLALALIYRAGAVGIEYIKAIPVRHVQVVTQRQTLVQLSLPSVFVAAPKTLEANAGGDLDTAFQSADSLIPKPLPNPMAEVPPTPPAPSPLDMLTQGVAISAVGSEGVFIQGLFYAWGSKYQKATIVGQEGNGIAFLLGKERRVVPTKPSPVAFGQASAMPLLPPSPIRGGS